MDAGQYRSITALSGSLRNIFPPADLHDFVKHSYNVNILKDVQLVAVSC